MSAAIVVAKENNVVSINGYREKIETIKQTVAKGASDAQLEMFMTLAERYQLDPFLKEIWFVPGTGIVTGRDGYLKVALRDPNYDGIVSAAVCEGDHFEINPVEPTVKHSFGGKRGQVIGAYAIVFHKHRRPAVCFAPYAEYVKGSPVWNTYKSAMICKVAEVLALKRQFGISGLVTEEEIGSGHEQVAPRQHQAPRATQPVTPPTTTIDVEPVDEESKPAKPWHNRAGMEACFYQIEEKLDKLDLAPAYANTLKEYGVSGPKEFKKPEDALACYRNLEEVLRNAESRVA